MKEEQIKSIAQMAWQSAANAFRMYPSNKHTFSEHWYASKETYLSSLPAPTQDGTNYAQCTCRNGLEAFKNCGHGQEEPPTQDGTAEEVLQELLDIEYHDDPQYANLESALISRKYCIQAMYNYAAPLRSEIERLKSELAASVSPKLVMPSDEIKLNESDKYGFRVPYDGSNNFYDRVAIKQFEDGWNACLSELRRLYPSLFK